MIKRRFVRPTQPKVWITANYHIKSAQVRVLTDRGENLGVMDTAQAIQEAQLQGKDLVMVTASANPPVAKIIEISKYKYQVQQKAADSRKKSRSQDTKEVRFTPFMSQGDFDSKMKRVMEFLERGDKVKVYVQFKGRAITKKEFGYDIMKRIFAQTAEIAKVESTPRQMGPKLEALLVPAGKLKKDTDAKL